MEFVAALRRDPLDFTQGWCPRVIERYEFYRATLAAYPALASLYAEIDGIDKTIRENEARHKDLGG